MHPHKRVPGWPRWENLHVGRVLRCYTIVVAVVCLQFRYDCYLLLTLGLHYILQCGKLRGVTEYCVCSVFALVAAAGLRFVQQICNPGKWLQSHFKVCCRCKGICIQDHCVHYALSLCRAAGNRHYNAIGCSLVLRTGMWQMIVIKMHRHTTLIYQVNCIHTSSRARWRIALLKLFDGHPCTISCAHALQG